MWQFAEAVRGLADGCQELGIPVTGGNVSFYNQTGLTAINPTPVVGVLGVLDDVRRRIPIGFQHDGDTLLLLGETRPELSGSEWAATVHGHLGGQPPAVDLAHEQRLAVLLGALGRAELVSAAHDLSDGGLASTLVEACLRHGAGARVVVPGGTDPFVFLFAESAGRVLLSVPRGHRAAVMALCGEHGVPVTDVGAVDAGSGTLSVTDLFDVPLDELRTAWTGTLPALFGAVPEQTVKAG
jgi:phosphoribosylformylglycinamidine synthase